jgi:4-hydroxy-3-polyprenylbenzoate decarboxylase
MNTLSAIACGCSDNLIKRAASVALKENRKLILISRESPLSLIHLKNMLAVKETGADIVLPVPEFYSFPETVNDVVNSVIDRTLKLLELETKSFFSV